MDCSEHINYARVQGCYICLRNHRDVLQSQLDDVLARIEDIFYMYGGKPDALPFEEDEAAAAADAERFERWKEEQNIG